MCVLIYHYTPLLGSFFVFYLKNTILTIRNNEVVFNMAKKKITKIPKINPFEYRVPLDSFKNRDKFVKRIERHVRSSMEYRDLMFYLKENMDFNKCVFFTHVENANGMRSKIEIHHEPFTLYDIADTIVRKYEEEGLPMNDMYIADEVMEIHYRNMIGLIPLSKTLHEVVHSTYKNSSDKLYIPIHLVYGNFREFIKEYGEYIDDSVYERYKFKIDKSKELTAESFNAIISEFEYLDIDGNEKLQKMEIEGENIA